MSQDNTCSARVRFCPPRVSVCGNRLWGPEAEGSWGQLGANFVDLASGAASGILAVSALSGGHFVPAPAYPLRAGTRPSVPPLHTAAARSSDPISIGSVERFLEPHDPILADVNEHGAS